MAGLTDVQTEIPESRTTGFGSVSCHSGGSIFRSFSVRSWPAAEVRKYFYQPTSSRIFRGQLGAAEQRTEPQAGHRRPAPGARRLKSLRPFTRWLRVYAAYRGTQRIRLRAGAGARDVTHLPRNRDRRPAGCRAWIEPPRRAAIGDLRDAIWADRFDRPAGGGPKRLRCSMAMSTWRSAR